MTDRQRAMHIGRNAAIKYVTFGLLIAQLIMMLVYYRQGLVDSFLWFSDFGYHINLVIAIAAIYFCAYILGGMVGISIIIKRRNYLWAGFLYGLMILIISTFLASLTGFFQERMDDVGDYGYGSPFFDYVFKPLFWVTITGIIPVLIVGFRFGFSIYKKGKNCVK